MEDSCSVCETLLDVMVNSAYPGDGLVPSDFSDARHCSRHMSVVRSLVDIGCNFARIHNILGNTYLVDTKNRPRELILLNNPSVPGHPGRYFRLDPDWVDTDLLMCWKEKCLTTHGMRCGNPMKVWPARPAWLIDVEDNCLVPGANSDAAFIALSYTYGAHSWFKVTDAITLASLQVPGSLGMPKISSHISPMVKHAMYMTKALGERFLWADALCIPHHNEKDTAEQLNLMGAIYANALVTIIAADTESKEGMPGLRGGSPSREMKRETLQFGTDQIVMTGRGYFTHDLFNLYTHYGERGWTYQECIMSGRKLILFEKEFRWECSCKSWREELGMGEPANLFRSQPSVATPQVARIMAGLPDMDSARSIFSNFNRRILSYDDDALPSITGLLSVFSRTFVGGFLFGLPERFFDDALAWYPETYDNVDMRRRKMSLDTSRPRLGPSGLPSWSWVGWQGAFKSRVTDNVFVRFGAYSTRETYPITTWFTAKSPTASASERRPIHSTWFKDREIYKAIGNDVNKPLPPGWTRYDAGHVLAHMDTLAHFPSPDDCGRFLFRHRTMEYEHEEGGIKRERNDWKRWAYYPFPAEEISTSTQPFTPEQTEYLFCETYKTHLWVADLEVEFVALKNSAGRLVGRLFISRRSSGAIFPSHVERDEIVSEWGDCEETSNEEPPEVRVELVAISRVRKYTMTRSTGYKTVATERIAVLWVEWVDGVAYRREYGEVDKEEWDKLPLEKIQLVMG